jgi:glucose-1-phosphate cytidylyltransferase
MVEIGQKPILWHIMRLYSAYGINDFIVCLGYMGYAIKEYFANYFLHSSDVTFDLPRNQMQVHNNSAEPWKVTLIDTGLETMTGGRLRRVLPYVDGETFCFTYGDGVADLDIGALVSHHEAAGTHATVTAVQPPGRFGTLELDGDRVTRFREKSPTDTGWISGGFFVLSPDVGEYLDDDTTTWEREPLEKLAAEGQLSCYRHQGFWHPMDTIRDRDYLNDIWRSGNAPWSR